MVRHIFQRCRLTSGTLSLSAWLLAASVVTALLAATELRAGAAKALLRSDRVKPLLNDRESIVKACESTR
jgi:hypothetical protein